MLLHADIVGSTLLVRRNETLAHQQIRRVFSELSGAIREHGGTTHEIRGDALVAEFARASDALAAAVAFQESAASGDPAESDELTPRTRIGIAMGEVIIADGTVTGDGIVMAQRLEQLAGPGGICVQASAYETVPARLGFSFRHCGEHTLKGFDVPVGVYSLDSLGPVAGSPAEDDSSTPPSIAVIPLDNISGEPDQEYFSDGITEDLITELGRFRNLFVCARHATFTLKNQSVDTEAARQLGADYLVTGSVRRSGKRVRISIQLVSAESGAQIWAERYDRDLHDIFEVQDEVVGSVVARLGFNLRREAMDYARKRPTDSLTAYDHLLRARFAWWQGEWNEGFRHTRAALEADPDYAQAHAWLALQYAYQTYGRSMGFSDEDISSGARQHAEKALGLDDQDAFVHMAASMAFGFTPTPDKQRGLHHSDISFRMNPHDFDILYCRAYHLAWSERPDEALEILERLDELNPLASFMVGECYVDTYFLLGRYEDCLTSYRGRGNVPNQVVVMMAASHAMLDRVEEARQTVVRLRRDQPDFDIEGFARCNSLLPANARDAERLKQGFRLSGIDV